MIRWCAYCQSFLGESEPFHDHSVTHGICSGCFVRLQKDEINLSEIRRIATFYNQLREQLTLGSISDLAAIVDHAISQLRLKPLDFFMGIIQPLLHEIGELWSSGKISVVKEHEFTAFAETLLGEIARSLPSGKFTQSNLDSLDVLLVCAQGNFHTVGIRSLALALNQSGLRTHAFYPGLPSEEIMAMINASAPRYLGISVSLPEQRDSVQDLVKLIQGSSPRMRPEIFVGGSDLKFHVDHWRELERLGVWLALDGFSELTEKLLSKEPQRMGLVQS